MVDEQGRQMINLKIGVEGLVSPLTALTGLTSTILEEEGMPLEAVLDAVKRELDPTVVLVGQRVQSDIDWLGLQLGVHYGYTIDLADEFKSFNAKFGTWNYFGLAQESWALLGKEIQLGSHSPLEDARVSMELYREWIKTGKHKEASQRLRDMRYKRGFPERPPQAHSIDGVCTAKFQPAHCVCGQPTGR